jgi:hypothetical protein
MAEGDGHVINNFLEQILLGELDLVDDTIKWALIGSGWSATIDGATLGYTDVSANEIVASGYVAGGATLSNKAVSQDDTNDRAEFDNTVDITWSSLASASPKSAFLYDDTHASKHGIAYWELTTDSNGGDYSLSPHADGLIHLTST